MQMLYFEPSKSFWGYMMKIKNIENVVLKVLIYVRTHPEELLVPKNDKRCIFDPLSHFGTIWWKIIEKFLAHEIRTTTSSEKILFIVCTNTMDSRTGKFIKWSLGDEEFFRMSSYTWNKNCHFIRFFIYFFFIFIFYFYFLLYFVPIW